MSGYELVAALRDMIQWSGGELCGEEWEAGLSVEDDWDPNYPEASGLPDGSDLTPEILSALRDGGEDPADFELWHVNAYRAIFISVDDYSEDSNVIAQVAQVLWLGIDPEGTPHWAAEFGSAFVACE